MAKTQIILKSAPTSSKSHVREKAREAVAYVKETAASKNGAVRHSISKTEVTIKPTKAA